MNAEAAQVLFDAQRRGVKQAFGYGRDGDAVCALVLLNDANLTRSLVENKLRQCVVCGARQISRMEGLPISNEAGLILHLNDDHYMSFAEIARKLGPDSV